FDAYSKDVQSTIVKVLSGKWSSEIKGWEPYDDMEKITNKRNFSKMALYYVAHNSISGSYADWQKNWVVLYDSLRQIHDSYYGEHHISEIYYLIKIAYIVEAVPELNHDIGLDKQWYVLPKIFQILMNYFTREGIKEFWRLKNHVMKIHSWCLFDEGEISSYQHDLKQFSPENVSPTSYLKMEYDSFKDLYDYFENAKPTKF
ncbi:MAG: hypothetical protein ACPG68_06440, partial [Candidatus Thalassarchaeaceae archaeon]